MALLIAAVDGLGPTGTVRMNLSERMREIGVVYAIGASGWLILRIVLVERFLSRRLAGCQG